VESFVSRLKALSTTHNLLTQGLWEKTALSDLVTAELEPYAGRRVTKIRGPDVSLTPYQAIGLGMVFHELATNAAKYGGLSHQNGSVVVEWSVDAKIQMLSINWEELGNTGINAPQTRGFGSRLIEQSIADLGGNIERDFRETGLVCKINVPVHSNRSPPQFEGLNSTIQVGM
jgi:two-component sensor histidine kinase